MARIKTDTKKDTKKEIEDLRLRLAEAEETLAAIRTGEVDALVVSGPEGEQVYLLKGTEHPYRILVESITEGAVSLIRSGDIIFCNNAFAALTGVPSSSLITSSIKNYISEKDIDRFERFWKEAVETRVAAEFELKSGRGPVSVLISCSAQIVEGEVTVFAVVSDISERKKSEAALKELNEKLEQRVAERTADLQAANKALRSSRLAALNMMEDSRATQRQVEETNRELEQEVAARKRAEEELHKLTEDLKRSNTDLQQFAYIASHDLQTPLRNIEGFTQLLARRYGGKLDDKADEFINYITTGVKDMQALILDILEYSKVGTESGTFKKTDTSLCVAKAISDLKETIKEKNADITYDEGFPVIMGDSVQLTSLFQNLIGNAIKFCKETPKIQLSVEKEGSNYIFSVRDNGIGIDPEDAKKIFAVFHRVHGKSEYHGTGIGLAICQKIVERHGGCIWVESEPGKGSTFFFTLPAHE